MAAPRRRAKVSPALLAFGRRLKRFREDAGLTQANIAERTNLTTSFVGQVELGKKRCTRKFTETIDNDLDLGGKLVELWDDLVKDSAFPAWFDWPEVEGEAIELVSYDQSIINGLLQTPAYAAVMLHGRQDKVDARIGRQRVFTREEPPPPDCLFLIDEFALMKIAGTNEIMREQLEHLISIKASGVKVQIVPARADHVGNVASFTLAVLEDLTEIVYVETFARGFTMADLEDIAEAHKAIREVSSLALPVDQSIEFVRRVIEGKWT
jgi:transcriptional regulator with XRE-family HTH domain